jgi:hypothetical protein
MTRKDYVLIAEALQAAAYALNPPERAGALLVAHEISCTEIERSRGLRPPLFLRLPALLWG